MIIVLDVSAAIEILFQRDKRERFSSVYDKAAWVISPDLYISEIANVLWKYHQAKVFNHEDCLQYVQDGISMVDDFISAKELWKEALSEGVKYKHSIYDMFYSVLARRNDATLISNDQALAKLCKSLKISICH